MTRGALHELEALQARAQQTSHLKSKEHARKSVNSGKSLTAIEALDTILRKRKEEANNGLKKAQRAVTIDQNRRKNELHIAGVQARKDERLRLIKLRAIGEGLIVGVDILPELLHPIRDPEKQPTPEDLEKLLPNPSLQEALDTAIQKKAKADNLTYNDLCDFPIDPAILDEERQRINKPLLMVEIDQDEIDEVTSDIESVVESVASYNSIAQNADFVSFV